MSTILPTYHVEAILQRDGALTLESAAFPAGQAVEVIIVPHAGGPDPRTLTRYTVRRSGTSILSNQSPTMNGTPFDDPSRYARMDLVDPWRSAVAARLSCLRSDASIQWIGRLCHYMLGSG